MTSGAWPDLAPCSCASLSQRSNAESNFGYTKVIIARALV